MPIQKGSKVHENMSKGLETYYLRIAPCFCTAPGTPLKTTTELWSIDFLRNLHSSLYQVDECPNRHHHDPSIPSELSPGSSSGSSPVRGPAGGPSTTRQAGMTGSEGPLASGATRLPLTPGRDEISPLDLDQHPTPPSPVKPGIRHWVQGVRESVPEPLQYEYPIIDEVKWANMTGPGLFTLAPSQALIDLAASIVSAAEGVIPPTGSGTPVDVGPGRGVQNGTPESATQAPTQLETPAAGPSMAPRNSRIPAHPDRLATSPPPRYTRRRAPPRYRSGLPDTPDDEERSPVFVPVWPPYGDRAHRRGNAMNAPIVSDPPTSISPLTLDPPSGLGRTRPALDTLVRLAAQLAPNPTDEEVSHWMETPGVQRELERFRIVYEYRPTEGHTWVWRGPRLGGSGQPDPQCLIM